MSNTDLVKEQLRLEQLAITEGIKHYRQLKAKNSPLPPDFALLKRCMGPTIEAIEEYVTSKKRGQLRYIKDILSQLPVMEVAYITVAGVLLSQEHMNLPIQSVAEVVATGIADQIEYKGLKEKAPGYLAVVEKSIKTKNKAHRRRVLKSSMKRTQSLRLTWDKKTRIDVGYKLVSLLIEATGVVKLVRGITKNRNECLILKFNDDVAEWVAQAHKKCEVLKPKMLPMVTPPVQWDSKVGGGYYTITLDLEKRNVAGKADKQKKPAQAILDGLNSLQNTEWSVNKDILTVSNELINRDGQRLGVLASDHDTYFPAKPWDETDDDAFKVWKELNPEGFQQWKNETSCAYELQVAQRSKSFAQAKIVAVARLMKEYKKIYFPWVLDFRGRAYPVANTLSPQGEDLSKAMLTFAEGKKIGDSGSYWLAFQGANTFGNDKVSLDDRVQWVEDNQELILDSASDPLGGQKYWTDADKPWQFLAFCFEWAGYIKEGAEFKTRLPVAVDGSCNGLQHFSALLRDEVGGTATNLKALPERSDIYTIVAQKVAEKVELDALDEERHAVLWNGLIDRKIIKRNVMTVPYGVTQRGMVDQIIAELKHKEGDAYRELKLDIYPASAYLGGVVHQAIEGVVESAVVGMNWFKEVVKVFNLADQPIRWTTPVGHQVYMHKLQTSTKRLKLITGETRVDLTIKTQNDKLNTRKQINGISPNIIHSLDASHLISTVNSCVKKGITAFGMVHDSYGTHACDMPVLFDELRKEFVKMYSGDVMDDLRNQWIAQLPEEFGLQLPPVPAFGTLNINEVLESEYFFA